MNTYDNNKKENEICYKDVVEPSYLWGNVSPFADTVPKLILQMALAIAVNHGVHLFFQRFGQPRFVSNIVTAMILSPSTLSIFQINLEATVIPQTSLTIMQTVANLGLTYATFIEALQTNAIPIAKSRPKMLCVSLFVFICPFIVGCSLYITFQKLIKKDPIITYGNVVIVSIYWGTIVTSTGFTTMAPILSKVKLLCTRVGQEALFVGLFNDFSTWCLINVILAISTSPNEHDKINMGATCYILLTMVLYIVFCSTLVKPLISRVANNLPDGESYSNFLVHMILFLVIASGLLTDYLGSHFIFGAYILGSSVPPGYLADTLIEKMEECVDGILMPLYFLMMGIRIDVFRLLLSFRYIWIILLAVGAKVLCTFIIGSFCNIPLDDSLPLGVLLSAKGLLPLVLLNIGQERGLITSDTFAMLFLIILLTTILVGPIMSNGCKRIWKSKDAHEQRSIEGADFSDTLNLITCIHDSRNIPSIIHLLEISNIATQYPASVHVTHLIELVGHASAMVMEHGESQDLFFWNLSSKIFYDRARARSRHIIEAFDDYMENHNEISSLKVLSVVSPIDSMHEDICSLAKDKETNLIILPYHKQQGVDGLLEDTNMEFGGVNQRVLDMAPCSIALLVDRGLRVSSLSTITDHSLRGMRPHCEKLQIAMVFIGGPDDREALTYAWRMACHSCVDLTLIRFLEGDRVMDEIDHLIDSMQWCSGHKESDIVALYEQKENEKQADNEFLREFQQMAANDRSMNYLEHVVNSGEEIVSSIKERYKDYNLYIIGRGQVRYSLLSVGLMGWNNEYKELGLLGNVLVTSDFTSNASVLVMQQYTGEVNQNDTETKSIEQEKEIIDAYHKLSITCINFLAMHVSSSLVYVTWNNIC